MRAFALFVQRPSERYKTEEAHKCSISPDYFSHVNLARKLCRPGLRSALGLACALALYFLSPLGRRSAIAQTGTVVQNDFEDGSLQGWIPRGPVTLTNTDEVPAHGGTRSLKTTGRTAGFNGPSLNAFGLLTKGSTYQVTAWVRLVAGESPTQIRVTMQRTVSGSNSFDSIASSSATGVTDAAWVQLSGLYAFGGNDPSALLLYIESSSATASYYVDDFSIVKIADPPGPPQTPTGWSARLSQARQRAGGRVSAMRLLQ